MTHRRIESIVKSLTRQSKQRQRGYRRLSWRKMFTEQLEDRRLLAGPELFAIRPDEDALMRDGDTLNVAPREFNLLFKGGANIDPATIAGNVQLVRAGADGIFDDISTPAVESADDVTVDLGFLGLSDPNNPVQIVMRPASSASHNPVRPEASFPDDLYQIQIIGSSVAPLENVAGEAFQTGTDFVQEFRLDRGAQVVAVVPQPVSRNTFQIALAGVADSDDQFSLGFSGNTTDPILVAPLATLGARIQAAVIADFPNVNLTDVQVVNGMSANQWDVTFKGQFAGEQAPPLTIANQAVTTGTMSVSRLAGLTQARNQILVYFDDQDLHPSDVENPRFYRLVNTSGTLATDDDSITLPETVTYDPIDDSVLLDFATDIADGTYRLDIGFSDELNDMRAVAVNVGSLAGAFDPANPSAHDFSVVNYLGESTTMNVSSNALDRDLYRVHLTAGDTLTVMTTPDPTLDLQIELLNMSGGTVAAAAPPQAAGSATPDKLDYTVPALGTGEYYVRITTLNASTGSYLLTMDTTNNISTSDANTSVASATPLGQLGDAGFSFTAQIQPQSLALPPLPGGLDDPGHRTIQAEAHIGSSGTAAVVPGPISVVTYQFPAILGFNTSGQPYPNLITEEEKEIVRSIFEIYAGNAGLEVQESEVAGMRIGKGDLRSADPGIGPNSGVAGLGGPGGVTLNNDLYAQADREFGDAFTDVMFHEIGHALGLGHSYDLPSDQGSPGPPGNVSPGDHDITHLRRITPPDSTDIDMYQFEVVSNGSFSAEVVAERIGQDTADGRPSSLLNSVLKLYRKTDTDIELIAQNDDYFGNDSYVHVDLEPGIYYVGVSSTGNADYDPRVPDSGFGGLTDGNYDLNLSFREDRGGSLRDADGTAFDGDADGNPGGIHQFWFESSSQTIFVDKDNDTTANTVDGDGTLAGPTSATRPYDTLSYALEQAGKRIIIPTDAVTRIQDGDRFTIDDGTTVHVFEFDSAGTMPVLPVVRVDITAASDASDVSEAVRAAIASQGLTVVKSATESHSTTANTLALQLDQTQVDSLDVSGTPALIDAPNLVRVVGAWGLDKNINTLADNDPYLLGIDTGGNPLDDGIEFLVPQGVTAMLQAGTLLKLNRAALDAGTSSAVISRSNAAIQILGTPKNSVFFRSYHNDFVGGDSNETNDMPATGDFGGIVFRDDSDSEAAGIFLNYVNHADINNGGGRVTVDSIEQVFSPIHLIDSRPTVSFNHISNGNDSAISASPDSFDDSLGRIGPDIHGNFLAGSTVDGLFIRIETELGKPLDRLEVNGRFNDADIAHVLTENLQIAGQPGGPIGQVETQTISFTTIPSGGSYQLTFTPAMGAAQTTAAIPFDALPTERLNEVQTIQAIGTTEGTFRLNLDGNLSQDAPRVRFDATAADVRAALESISGISSGDVVVTGGPINVAPVRIEFTGDLAGFDQNTLLIDSSSVRKVNGGPLTPPIVSENEFQRISATGAAVGGLFGLSFRGTTGAATLNYNATSSDVQTYLNSLGPVLTANDVTVYGGPLNLRPIYVEFTGGGTQVTANSNVSLLSAANSTLSVTPTITTFARPAAQLPSDLFSVQQHLEALPGILGGQISVSGDGAAGDPLTVVFGGFGTQDVNQITVATAGDSAAMAAVTDQEGGVLGRPAGRLVVDPGVVVKLGKARIEAERGSATLIAEGTKNRPVIFTSINDDRFGGSGKFDVNGNGTTTGNAGDWAGLIFNHGTFGSIDQALITFGGGDAPIDGFGDAEFNVLEVHDAKLRLTNSEIVDNANGQSNSTRDGRGMTTATTLFGRGAQPIIVNNVFKDNAGSVLDLNANSLSFIGVRDSGRSTGLIEDFDQLADNHGPLVRLNRMAGNAVNGMVIRGEELTTESIWDDTDIVHVLRNEILVDNHHTYSGLRLQSSNSESLVVKMDTTGAITATGTPLDIDDRIGGTVQVLGSIGHPVVLSDLRDDSVGAGFTPSGGAILDTNNNGPSQGVNGAWRGLLFDEFSNDRNVAVVRELEDPLTDENDVNSNINVAQVLGVLAPNEKSGDETSRLGFEVHGFISPDDPTDMDVYSFRGTAGTEIWLDIDRTDPNLDVVLELLNSAGTVQARSVTNASTDIMGTSVSAGVLAKEPLLGGDYYTQNVNDPGMRLTLPGTTGAIGTYFVRVRSAPAALPITTLDTGASRGAYQLQVRLRQQDEFPGSIVQYADIRFARTGIDVRGLPTHSPLSGDVGEIENGDLVANANTLVNLLQTDRAMFSIAGVLDDTGAGTDVDWYEFELNHTDIQVIGGVNDAGGTVAVTFDLDYSDGAVRGDTTLAVFDQNNRLIFVGRESDIANDQPAPGQHPDIDDLSRGSLGVKDAYIGPVHIPVGNSAAGQRYYLAVMSDRMLPTALMAAYDSDAANKLVRLEPINLSDRIVEDHIGNVSYHSHGALIEANDTDGIFDIDDELNLGTHVTPFTLQDVVLYVTTDNPNANDGDALYTVDPFGGGNYLTRVANNYRPNQDDVQDIVIRSDGRFFAYAREDDDQGNVGTLLQLDPQRGGLLTAANGGLFTNGTASDNITTEGTTIDLADNPGNTDERFNDVVSSDDVDALTFERTGTTGPASAPIPSYDLYYSVRETDVPTSVGVGQRGVNSKLYKANAADGGADRDTNSPNDFGEKGDIQPAGITYASRNFVFNNASPASVTVRVEAKIPGAAGNFDINVTRADETTRVTSVNFSNDTSTTPHTINLTLDTDGDPTAGSFINALNDHAEARRLVIAGAQSGGQGTTEDADGKFSGANVATTTDKMFSMAENRLGLHGPLSGRVTGLAFADFDGTGGGLAGQLFGVTDAGEFLFIQKSTGVVTKRLDIAATFAQAGIGSPTDFQGLSLGPQNVEEGFYANTLFAITSNGTLYAFDAAAAVRVANADLVNDAANAALEVLPVLRQVFDTNTDGSADSISVQVTNLASNAVGLAFSPLDFNLWHPTTNRRNDAGHGINNAPDNSRNPGNEDFSITSPGPHSDRSVDEADGAASFYFGFEEYDNSINSGDQVYLTYQTTPTVTSNFGTTVNLTAADDVFVRFISKVESTVTADIPTISFAKRDVSSLGLPGGPGWTSTSMVQVVGNDIQVLLDTDAAAGVGATPTTAAELISAISADPAANELIYARVESGNALADITTTTTATYPTFTTPLNMTTTGALSQFGIRDVDQQIDLSSNTAIRDTYDLPGGALGSLRSSSFSLDGYSDTDRPTLYFTYFLETENHPGSRVTNDNTSNFDSAFRDSARAFASRDGGLSWELLATSNSQLSDPDPTDGPRTAELPGFLSHLSDAGLNSTTPRAESQQIVQELFDNTGEWRQARVDLSTFAGEANIMLRFDFSTAGSMNDASIVRIDDASGNAPFGEFSNNNRSIRSDDNNHEGFYIDDIIVGFAERGEMVTGASPDATIQNLFEAGERTRDRDPNQNPDIFAGPYQVEVRRSGEYAGLNDDGTITLSQQFDTNDRHILTSDPALTRTDDFEGGTPFTYSSTIIIGGTPFTSPFPWSTNSTVSPQTGTQSAQAGVITHNQASVLSLTLSDVVGANPAAGAIRFAYSVESEYESDGLRFYIDGVPQIIPGQAGDDTTGVADFTLASGLVPYQEITFNYGGGDHVFSWVYSKDAAGSIGLDTAFIDNIVVLQGGTGLDADSNRVQAQGQFIIDSNRIINSSIAGINVQAGAAQGGGTMAHPGAARNFPQQDQNRLVPGVVVQNNVIAAAAGANGIQFAGSSASNAFQPVPYGRLINNTVFGNGQATTGIMVGANAAPTILNNVVSGFATGISVAGSSTGTVISSTAYHATPTRVSGATDGSSPLLLAANEPLFSDTSVGNFYPADGSRIVDSSLNTLQDRFDFTNFKNALAIPPSAVNAPNRDVFGQLREDSAEDPLGGGSAIFKDRGAVDKSDDLEPYAQLLIPVDNDAEGFDLDQNESVVYRTNVFLSEFSILLGDGDGPNSPFKGTGVDERTVDDPTEVSDPNNPDATVSQRTVRLTRNGIALVEDVDYTLGYNANNDVLLLTPLSSLWESDSVYEIVLDNTLIKDRAGNSLRSNQANGLTTFTIMLGDFEFDYGDAKDTSYTTLRATDGARHVLLKDDPNTLSDESIHLGSRVDSEFDGQPTALADGDDRDQRIDLLTSTLTLSTAAPFSLALPTDGGLGIADEDKITVTDGVGMVTFIFDLGGDGLMSGMPMMGETTIAYDTADTVDVLAQAIIDAIAAQVTAGNLGATVATYFGDEILLVSGATNIDLSTTTSITAADRLPFSVALPANGGLGIADNDQITVTDGVGSVTFTFDLLDNGVATGPAIPYFSTDSVGLIAQRITDAIAAEVALGNLGTAVADYQGGTVLLISGATAVALPASITTSDRLPVSVKVPAAAMADAATFSINDGNGAAVIFEFEDAGAAGTPGLTNASHIQVDFNSDGGSYDPQAVATSIAAAINSVFANSLSATVITPTLDTVAITTAIGDDDDGVVFVDELFIPGVSLDDMTTIEVEASAAGKLDAWIDFNGNSRFDVAEKIFDSVDVVAGVNSFGVDLSTFTVGFVPGQTVARFRISERGGLFPSGLGVGGEVEDHVVRLLSNVAPAPAAWADVNVDEDSADTLVDLRDANRDATLTDPVFTDVDISNGNGDDLTYALIDAGDSTLVAVTLVDNQLTLDYQQDKNGTTTVVIEATDHAGMTARNTLTINVTALNDAPEFTLPTDPAISTVNEDAGAQIIAGFATGRRVGPLTATDESSQMLTMFNIVSVTQMSGNLTFASAPAINSNTGVLTFTSDANTNGTAQVVVTLTDDGPTGANSPNGGLDVNTSAAQTFTITVTPVNDAPTMTTSTTTLTPVNEGETSVEPSVATIIGATISDIDTGASSGIAVTSVGGSGTWEYLPNATTTWLPVGTVSESAARLLTPLDQLRFVSDGDNGGTATLTYRAWDQTTTQVAGDVGDASTTGGISAFSVEVSTVSIVVTPVNDAPVLNASGTQTLDSINEDAITNAGTRVDGFVGATIVDVDTGALGGIAVTGVNGSDLNGSLWQYSTDDGTNWIDVGTVSGTSALLLRSEDRLRFIPNRLNGETATVTYQAWDQTGATLNQHGMKVNPAPTGGVNAFSDASDTASLLVTDVNDSPVLTADGAFVINPSVDEDTPSAGQLVSAILGATVTDVDTGAVEGIAVHTTSGNGNWQYALMEDTNTFFDFGMISETSALLLRSSDLVRYNPDKANAETATFNYYSWDQSDIASNAAGTKVSATVRGGVSPLGQLNASGDDSVQINVTGLQDAPVLDPQTPVLAGTNEDTNLSNVLISSFATGISDVDLGALVGGIAITGLTGNGTWRYSTDGGASYTEISPVANDSALLLLPTHHIEYVPDGENGETATITYRAWDQTSGTVGNKVDTTTNGGLTAFSLATDTASLVVTDVNDSPKLAAGAPTLTGTDENNPSSGDTVMSLIGTTISDVDNGSVDGIAIVGVTGNGTWQYQLDGETTWQDVGAVDSDNARLLTPADSVRFLPDNMNGGAPTFTYVAWDQSDIATNAAGDLADANPAGGTTPFSDTANIATIVVTSINDAPVVTDTTPQTLPGTNEDTPSPSTTVSAMVGSTISDVDTGALLGVAITGMTGNGTWQYALQESPSMFIDFPAVDTGAFLLRAADLIQYVPDNDNGETATLTYRAWDQTSGMAGDSGVNTTTNGDTTAFSMAEGTASLEVTHVNDRPIANNDSGVFNVSEDVPKAFIGPGILGNDTDVDLPAQTLTVASVNGQALVNSQVTITTGQGAAVTVSDNGSFNYSAAVSNTLQALPVGQTVNDTFTYTIRDNGVGPDNLESLASGTVTVTVTGVNDRPTAGNVSVTTHEPTSATDDATVTGTFDGRDVDSGEQATLRYRVVSEPSAGTITPNIAAGLSAAGDATFTFDPGTDFEDLGDGETRQVFFRYVAEDTHGLDSAVVGTVTVTVTGTNDKPIAQNVSVSTTEDGPNINTGGFIATDVDGDSLTYEITTPPAKGTATLSGASGFAFSVGSDFQDLDAGDIVHVTFTYRANEDRVGGESSADATVTVTVIGRNDAPIANNDTNAVTEDVNLSISGTSLSRLLANDTDVDANDSSALTVISADAVSVLGAAVTVDSQGGYTYDPKGVASLQALRETPAESINDTFTYTIKDTQNITSRATVTITVSGVNDAPVARTDFASTQEDVVLSPNRSLRNLLANDTDADQGETLTLMTVVGTTTSTMGAAVSIGADGSYTYDPTGAADIQALQQGEVDSDTFTYSVRDVNGAVSIGTVSITLSGANDSPTAGDDSASVDEDYSPVAGGATPIIANVFANDTDPDDTVLTLRSFDTVSELGASVSISANGAVTYDPRAATAIQALSAGQTGTDRFVYQVADSKGVTDSATITVSLTGQNDEPVAFDDTLAVLQSSMLVVADAAGVLSNDFDAENQTLTVASVNGQSANVGTSFTLPSGATLQISAAGAINYNPTTSASLRSLPDGVTGIDTFTYSTSDGIAESLAPATVTITVTGVNDAPVARPDLYTVSEDFPLAVSAPGVISNDSDVDSDPLSAVAFSGVSTLGALVALNADGSLTYDPRSVNVLQSLKPSASSQDTFIYKVSDGKGATASATVTVTVTGANDAPEGVGDTFRVSEDAKLIVSGLGVLENDRDKDNDPLTVTVFSAISSQGAPVMVNQDGTFTYDPTNLAAAQALAPGGTLTDTFTYQASDGDLLSASVTVTVIVDGQNDAPVAGTDTYSVNEDTKLTVSTQDGVLANDSDLEQSPIAATLLTSPVSGIAVLNSSGFFTYTPNPNFSGVDTFTYSVSDGAASSVGTVTINVLGVNDAPVAFADSYSVAEGDTLTVDQADGVLANDVDLDQENLIAIRVNGSGPTHGSLVLEADGSFTYVPEAGFFGSDSFQYFAQDAANTASSPVTVSIDVANIRPKRNSVEPLDVNADGAISPIDALLVVNELNKNGSHDIPSSTPAVAPFWDVNGDGVISPLDALLVINRLNSNVASEGEGASVFADTEGNVAAALLTPVSTTDVFSFVSADFWAQQQAAEKVLEAHRLNALAKRQVDVSTSVDATFAEIGTFESNTNAVGRHQGGRDLLRSADAGLLASDDANEMLDSQLYESALGTVLDDLFGSKE